MDASSSSICIELKYRWCPPPPPPPPAAWIIVPRQRSRAGGPKSALPLQPPLSTCSPESIRPTSSPAWAARSTAPGTASSVRLAAAASTCTTSAPSLRRLCGTTPFHPDHQLAFVAKPAGGGFLRSRCDVCGRATRGFAFRCAASCGFEMHPCCAAMGAEMNFAVHQHPLAVLPPQPAAGARAPAAVCSMCQRKRSGLVYRCAACGYSLHAACANKDLVNGLFAHGFRSPPEKPSKLGAAAREATQALFGIIGGLIEGIGEGIGEAFVDNIGRGTSSVIGA